MNEITVVIPAYNAARCIERAVKSLLSQTIPVDIVVVNDGSTDETAMIASNLGVRVITQENAGAYKARVNGANLAKTPYIGFMDADDFAHPEMYEKLLEFAKRNNLDIAQCDYTGKGYDVAEIKEELFLNESEVTAGIIQSRFVKGNDAVHVWDKLYRREMVQNFESSRIMMFEDLAINAQAFVRAKRVGYFHETLYDYDVNEGSSVRNFRLRNVDDLKEAIRFRKKYYVHFGLKSNDISHSRWICRNVRNMYIVACSAPIRDSVSRMTKVNSLLDIDEVRLAFAQCGISYRWRLMHCHMVVMIVNVLKQFQSLIRK